MSQALPSGLSPDDQRIIRMSQKLQGYPIILSPEEERAHRDSAQAAALASLRINHPDLISISVPSAEGECFTTRFGVDVMQDNLLSVLLRPYPKRICDSLIPDGRKESPKDFMYLIVKEALNNLDIDIADLEKLGIVFGCNHECTDDTYIHGYISYLREALFNLHKLHTRTQKAVMSRPDVQRDMKLAAMAGGSEATRAAAVAAAARIRAAFAAAEKTARNVGGAKHTRKHKHRKTRKSRKYSRK